ncbi:MAG: HAMP domain-containing sensor histidine kinase [bacterium]
MLRRLLPTLLVFGCGFLALVWGLASLQSIFARERDQAREGVRARRKALRHYARQALREELGRRLQLASEAIRAAVADPLAPADGLLMIDSGEQLLPRPVRFREGAATPAKALFVRLRKPGAAPTTAEPDSPWAARLRLRRRFLEAVQSADTSQVENVFRDLLAHRASFVIATTRDVPYMLALLEFFSSRSTPDPALMKLLLRDGFVLGRGRRMLGLQRLLLTGRERFSAADFAFLRERLIALCRQHRVAHDDFRTRAQATPRPLLALPKTITGAALTLNARYYVAPDGSVLRGARVELAALLQGVSGRMARLGLLGARDRVSVLRWSPDVQPVETLALRVSSPSWSRHQRDIARRYRLKTALGVVCGALALILAIFAVVFQLRRQSYLQLKSDFVSSVSHELRTPLASIRLLAETLERRTAGQPEVRGYPARIVRDVDGLTFLVENILSFSRLDKGRWVVKPRRIRLDELVSSVQGDLEAATDRALQVTTYGLEDVLLEGDPELVRLLLANLGRNGCLYNTRDPVELRFHAEQRDGRARLRITDNGVGIAGAERDKIFREFYRPADPTGRGVRGSGLGLAMCRRIMRLHRGTIRLADTGPEGTTFELEFPERS